MHPLRLALSGVCLVLAVLLTAQSCESLAPGAQPIPAPEARHTPTPSARAPEAASRPAAVAPRPKVKPEPSPTVTTASPPPAPGERQLAPPAYRAVESAVARLRGLAPTRDVELRFMTQAELGQFFLESFEREYTPAERQRDQKLLTMLGLIRPDQDLAAVILDLLSQEVAGLYDDGTARMYLIDGTEVPTAADKITFAHEFTHALQDQYFDLKALNPPNSENDDRSAAIQALVEGDATLLMGIYARGELTGEERRQYAQSQGRGQRSALEDAPLVLRTELTFPYIDGLRFVQAIYRQGGFAAVDAAFYDPPDSTEQILHPEKYAARELPIAVLMPDLAPALGEGWRQTESNTLGELDVRILVEQFTSRSTAERAASGWGGDRYAMLEDASGRSAVAMKISWDGSQDAWEFFRAYNEGLRNRYSQARVLESNTARQTLAGDGYAAMTILQGVDVLIVLAPDESVMATLGQVLSGS